MQVHLYNGSEMGGFLVGALLQKHVVLLYCYSCEDDTVKLARHLCEQRQWRIARGYAQQNKNSTLVMDCR